MIAFQAESIFTQVKQMLWQTPIHDISRRAPLSNKSFPRAIFILAQIFDIIIKLGNCLTPGIECNLWHIAFARSLSAAAATERTWRTLPPLGAKGS
jgi:hypothetical protein